MDTKSKWTEEMDNLLRGLMDRKAKKKDLMIAYPAKTYNAICQRMFRLRLDSSHLNDPPRENHKWESIKRYKPPEVQRKCMACGSVFMSSGPGNRLCMTHRRDSDDGTFAVKIR